MRGRVMMASIMRLFLVMNSTLMEGHSILETIHTGRALTSTIGQRGISNGTLQVCLSQPVYLLHVINIFPRCDDYQEW